MNKRIVQWSSLPRDLLSSIAQRLTTRTDLRHFRAVCTSWRSSTSSSLKIPFPQSLTIGNFFLIQSTIYCIQPLNRIINTRSTPKSWFIKLQENPIQPDKMLLVDPLSTFQIHKLPKSMPKTINSLDYKVTEIHKVFSFLVNPWLKKVVASSTFVDGDFMVSMLFTSGNLSVFKMGDMWTNSNHNQESKTKYDDVVFYEGKFYVVKDSGCVLVIDSSFNITEIASAVVLVCKHLVVSFGELFLLGRCFSEEREFDSEYPFGNWKVYKLNEEKKDWVLVNSLGDRAFFVTYDGSFSVSVGDFPGCKGNTIYFEDDIFIKGKGDYPGHRGGIYNLEDGSVGPLSDFPGYLKIFWPPPTWLKRNHRSS